MKKLVIIFLLTVVGFAAYAEEIEVVDKIQESEETIAWASSLTVDGRSSPVPFTSGKELSRTVSTNVSGSLGVEMAGFSSSFEVGVGESFTDTVYAEATVEPGYRVVLKFGSYRQTITLTRITYKRRADGSIWKSTTSGKISGTTGSITQGFEHWFREALIIGVLGLSFR